MSTDNTAAAATTSTSVTATDVNPSMDAMFSAEIAASFLSSLKAVGGESDPVSSSSSSSNPNPEDIVDQCNLPDPPATSSSTSPGSVPENVVSVSNNVPSSGNAVNNNNEAAQSQIQSVPADAANAPENSAASSQTSVRNSYEESLAMTLLRSSDPKVVAAAKRIFANAMQKQQHQQHHHQEERLGQGQSSTPTTQRSSPPPCMPHKQHTYQDKFQDDKMNIQEQAQTVQTVIQQPAQVYWVNESGNASSSATVKTVQGTGDRSRSSPTHNAIVGPPQHIAVSPQHQRQPHHYGIQHGPQLPRSSVPGLQQHPHQAPASAASAAAISTSSSVSSMALAHSTTTESQGNASNVFHQQAPFEVRDAALVLSSPHASNNPRDANLNVAQKDSINANIDGSNTVGDKHLDITFTDQVKSGSEIISSHTSHQQVPTSTRPEETRSSSVMMIMELPAIVSSSGVGAQEGQHHYVQPMLPMSSSTSSTVTPVAAVTTKPGSPAFNSPLIANGAPVVGPTYGANTTCTVFGSTPTSSSADHTTATGSTGNVDGTKTARRERNRMHARKTRQRKKEHMQGLRERADYLKQRHLSLRNQINDQLQTADILLVIGGGGKGETNVTSSNTATHDQSYVANGKDVVVNGTDVNKKDNDDDTSMTSTTKKKVLDSKIETLLKRPLEEIPDPSKIQELPSLFLPSASSNNKKRKYGSDADTVSEADQSALVGAGFDYHGDIAMEDSTTADINFALLQKDRATCTTEELDLIRKERNRMHAKRTRDRKRRFMEEMHSLIGQLEEENNILEGYVKQGGGTTTQEGKSNEGIPTNGHGDNKAGGCGTLQNSSHTPVAVGQNTSVSTSEVQDASTESAGGGKRKNKKQVKVVRNGFAPRSRVMHQKQQPQTSVGGTASAGTLNKISRSPPPPATRDNASNLVANMCTTNAQHNQNNCASSVIQMNGTNVPSSTAVRTVPTSTPPFRSAPLLVTESPHAQDSQQTPCSSSLMDSLLAAVDVAEHQAKQQKQTVGVVQSQDQNKNEWKQQQVQVQVQQQPHPHLPAQLQQYQSQFPSLTNAQMQQQHLGKAQTASLQPPSCYYHQGSSNQAVQHVVQSPHQQQQPPHQYLSPQQQQPPHQYLSPQQQQQEECPSQVSTTATGQAQNGYAPAPLQSPPQQYQNQLQQQQPQQKETLYPHPSTNHSIPAGQQQAPTHHHQQHPSSTVIVQQTVPSHVVQTRHRHQHQHQQQAQLQQQQEQQHHQHQQQHAQQQQQQQQEVQQQHQQQQEPQQQQQQQAQQLQQQQQQQHEQQQRAQQQEQQQQVQQQVVATESEAKDEAKRNEMWSFIAQAAASPPGYHQRQLQQQNNNKSASEASPSSGTPHNRSGTHEASAPSSTTVVVTPQTGSAYSSVTSSPVFRPVPPPTAI